MSPPFKLFTLFFTLQLLSKISVEHFHFKMNKDDFFKLGDQGVLADSLNNSNDQMTEIQAEKISLK